MVKDADVLSFTGLPNSKMLHAVFNHTKSGMEKETLASSKLSPLREFMVTVVKLHTDCAFHDLAYRTTASISTISRILLRWLTALDLRLSFLVYWTDREALWKTMPRFVNSFGRTRAVIIDCFEVFVERPSSLVARAQTYSSYKHHNTIKILLGTTPQGAICFVSDHGVVKSVTSI